MLLNMYCVDCDQKICGFCVAEHAEKGLKHR